MTNILTLVRENASLDKIKQAIKDGVDLKERTKADDNALHLVSMYGYIKIFKFLILKFPEIDERNKYGYTPLILASWKGYTNIVRILIRKGANIDARNESGYTALDYAIHCGHTKIVKLIKEAKKAKLEREYNN